MKILTEYYDKLEVSLSDSEEETEKRYVQPGVCEDV